MIHLKNVAGLSVAVVVLLSVGFVEADSATKFELGLKGGVNVNKITGSATEPDSFSISDPGSGSSIRIGGSIDETDVGFAFGGYGTAYLTDRFGVRLEALYTRKGGKGPLGGQGTFGGQPVTFTGENSISIDYIEFPLLALVTLPAGASSAFEIFAGPALAVKTGADYTVELSALGESDKETVDISDDLKSTDFSGVAGAAFVFQVSNARLSIEGRYTLGFTNVIAEANDPEIKNRAFSFRAGVGFPLGQAGE